MACDPKAVNLGTARAVPFVLLGAIGYATYTTVSPLCIHYLIRPDPIYDGRRPRPGTAAAILTIYFILFTLMLTAMFRVNYTIIANPGYVERGELWYQQNPSQDKRRKKRRRRSKRSKDEKGAEEDLENGNNVGLAASPPGLDEFTSRDVFSCDHNGYPIWCSHCLNYKPDRAHHCSEVGRCVRKMDHFCPWVGGVVGETTFKFFIQFVSYAAIYCLYVVIIFAIFLAENGGITSSHQANWIGTLALGAFFGLFTAGMSLHSLNFAFNNLTTIENLNKKWKVWELAVRIPDPETLTPSAQTTAPHENPQFVRTVVFQAPASESNAKSGQEKDATPEPLRTKSYAILHSEQGENVWDVGTMQNLKSVMGNSVIDWFLPIRGSPCADHSSTEAAFPVGARVESMRAEALQYAIHLQTAPPPTMTEPPAVDPEIESSAPSEQDITTRNEEPSE